MAPSIDTMSLLPCAQSSLIDAAASSAAGGGGETTLASGVSSASAPATSTTTPAAAAQPAASTPDSNASAAPLKTYATPTRPAGSAAVTPSNEEAQPGEQQVVVSSSSAEEAEATTKGAPPAAAMAATSVPPAQAVDRTASSSAVVVAKAKKAKKKKAHANPPAREGAVSTPSIRLSPRVSPSVAEREFSLGPRPALKRPPPQRGPIAKREVSPVRSFPAPKPRTFGGSLAKKGRETLSALFRNGSSSSSSSSSQSQQSQQQQQPQQPQQFRFDQPQPQRPRPAKREEADDCPSTPAAQGNKYIPAPSSFLAAQISPLRSSARRTRETGGGGGEDDVAMSTMPRGNTPPPAADSIDESFKMFLSPRTPGAATQFDKGAKSSGLTPRFGLTPGLTPTNFASDFGKGNKQDMNALDASNVFAWLNTPTAEGLFSPTGLTSLSVTNTPRGMYGFSGPSGKTPTAAQSSHVGFKLAPSPSKSYFAELEHGGDFGVDTPKASDGTAAHRSMICISPLASSKRSSKRRSALPDPAGAPDTPVSIDFAAVFASPRLPAPRFRGEASSAGAVASSDSRAPPPAAALHAAERDVELDDDLNALLQLAGTATPGGRSAGFLSPLLSDGLRRQGAGGGYNSELVRNGARPPPPPPSSLQLPVIGRGGDAGSSPRRLARKGTPSSANGGGASPPRLAIRTSLDANSPARATLPKSSLKKKSKKRKSDARASPDLPASLGHNPRHAGAAYYRHAAPPAPGHPGAAHGYYRPPQYPAPHAARHGPAYPAAYPPAPRGGYAYPERPGDPPAPAAAASIVPPKASPAADKPSRKAKGSRRTKSKSRATAGSASAAEGSRPPAKRSRKSSSRSADRTKRSSPPDDVPPDPLDSRRIAAAIHAVDAAYGDGPSKDKKLAAATLRGVTQRPSGKWQAQLYYAGKSRYIGVFDSKQKASLAYEIAREVLRSDDSGGGGPRGPEETDRNVALARRAAFAGVNEHAAK